MMESNFSRMVNGYEYYYDDVPNLGFGVPSLSDFDLRLDRVQPSIWVPSTQQDQDQDSPPGGADEIDSENTLLKYVNQLLMEEEETLAENQSLSSHDALALRQTEEMLQQVITDSHTQSPYSSGGGGEYLNSNSDSCVRFKTITKYSTECCDVLYDQEPNMLRSFGQPANEILVRGSMFSDADSPNITPPSSINSSSSSSSSSDSCVRFKTITNSTECEGPNMLRGFRQPANEVIVRGNMFSDANSVMQFKRGLEEASKFLPNTDQWIFNQKGNNISRVRKHHQEPEEEARRSKQSAENVDDGKLTEMFDKVLLLDGKYDPQAKPVGSIDKVIEEGGNVSTKVPASKDETDHHQAVDFRTLLILCAQSISTGDMITSDDLLKQIRSQSSPLGDSSQRLAHFFANALEARLQGSSGGVIQSYYDSVATKKRTAAQTLKSYKTFLSASPFMTLMYFYSNKMILDAAKDASVLHVIDFGILYGFQWPMFIQRMSKSKTGPRKLRITGVELPQNGFRPTEKLEDTGRRLREYCKRFGVAFEYNAIASKNWETIRLEEFKIRPKEVLAVNAVLRFKNLRDVTPGEEGCPREGFLKLIRDMKPDVFVNSTVNGSFNASFFTTRFKEALFHYTAVFDMFGSTLARENPERMHFEEVFYGREVMNVVACEGVDRVERPETYKQWQVRMVRAGFKQKPVEAELVESFRVKMKKWGYHKDFVLDEDSNWFLQGWKGRILFSSSCWVPS